MNTFASNLDFTCYVMSFVFRGILSCDEMLHVPLVISQLTTKRVFTSELISGVPVDQLSGEDQDSRNQVLCGIL